MAFSVIAVSISVSPFFTDDVADRHVHHVGAEALAGELEGRLRAGRGFEEKVDQRAPAQHGLLLLDLARQLDRRFGEVEEADDLGRCEALDAQ